MKIKLSKIKLNEKKMSMFASNLIENIKQRFRGVEICVCGVRELFSLNLNFFCYLFEYYNKKIKERKDFISI